MCGQRRRLRNLPGGGYFLQVNPDGALDSVKRHCKSTFKEH